MRNFLTIEGIVVSLHLYLRYGRMMTIDKKANINKKEPKSGGRSLFLQVAGAFAILLSAILFLGILEILFRFGPGSFLSKALSWALFFGIGILVSELIIGRANLVKEELTEKNIEMKASRDNYKEIAEEVPFPLSVICEDGRIAFHNRAFEAIFNLEAFETEVIDFYQFVDISERADFRNAFIECVRGGKAIERVEVSILLDGQKRLFEAVLKPFGKRIAGNSCCEVLLRDISQRKGFIEKMEGLESFSNEIVRQSPVGIIVISEKGDVESVNDAATRILGLKKDELIQKNIFDEDIQVLDQFEIVEAYESKKAFQQLKDISSVRYVNEKMKASYSVFPVLNTRKELVRVVFMIQDITETIRAKTELDSQRQRMDMFFDNAADCIIISDKNGDITMANRSAAELTGYDIDELVGMKFGELFTAEEREIAYRQSAWLDRKKRIQYESIFLNASGRSIEVDISATKISDISGEIIMNVVRDVTERKELMNRLSITQKTETIGEMAKGVALDFNNVLEAIHGAAELAKETYNDDIKTHSYIDVILHSAERGANLTKHLLNYARQSLNESELLDMNDVASEAISLLEQSFEKNIKVEVKLDQNIGPVSGDKALIIQAIINLALNAKDAMPDGGEITISTNRFDASEDFAREHPGIAPGPYVELLVQDSGIGIEKEVLPKIFDPFFTTKTESGSTGLGLPMVYNTVKSHGGYIDVKSVPFGGTEVRMFFPSPVIPDDLEKRVILQKRHNNDVKIMIVDDEDVIQTVIEGILKQLGYEVVRAQSGKEALEYLTDNDGEIDLILLDMIMPGLSGWDVFRRLKQFWPEIPVIVVTGYAQEEHLRYMLEEGLEGLIHKPFKASLLSDKIEDVLSKKNQR